MATIKNISHNPVKISNSFKNPKNLKILVTNPHLTTKQVILVTNLHLTTSPVRVRMVWSPWSKGFRQDPMQDYYKTPREKQNNQCMAHGKAGILRRLRVWFNTHPYWFWFSSFYLFLFFLIKIFFIKLNIFHKPLIFHNKLE